MGILGKVNHEFGDPMEEWNKDMPTWLDEVRFIPNRTGLYGAFKIEVYQDGSMVADYYDEWPSGKAAVPVDLYCWLTQHPEYGAQWLSKLKPMKAN